MTTVLITGCDYGIGYEFARQYAEAGYRVHAICLEAASREKIAGIAGDVHFHVLDVSDQNATGALAETLKDQPIDILINNAATFAPDGPGTLKLPDIDEFMRVMKINAAAPIYVSAAFEEHVAASEKKMIAQTRIIGCISTPIQHVLIYIQAFKSKVTIPPADKLLADTQFTVTIARANTQYAGVPVIWF